MTIMVIYGTIPQLLNADNTLQKAKQFYHLPQKTLSNFQKASNMTHMSLSHIGECTLRWLVEPKCYFTIFTRNACHLAARVIAMADIAVHENHSIIMKPYKG